VPAQFGMRTAVAASLGGLFVSPTIDYSAPCACTRPQGQIHGIEAISHPEFPIR
jgi:hypothetical protein